MVVVVLVVAVVVAVVVVVAIVVVTVVVVVVVIVVAVVVAVVVVVVAIVVAVGVAVGVVIGDGVAVGVCVGFCYASALFSLSFIICTGSRVHQGSTNVALPRYHHLVHRLRENISPDGLSSIPDSSVISNGTPIVSLNLVYNYILVLPTVFPYENLEPLHVLS